MKRFTLVMTITLVLLLTLLLATSPALAGKSGPTTVIETMCSLGPPERAWMAGNTYHARMEFYTSILESADPRLSGSHGIWGNYNINLMTMDSVVWGSNDQVVPAFNGGWKGRWQRQMTITDPLVIKEADGYPLWLGTLHGNAHGFGDLQGLQSHFKIVQSVEVYETLEDIPEEVPCVTGRTIEGYYFVLQGEHETFITGREDE